MSPTASASYGNVDLDRQAMGKNRERACFSPRLRPPRQTRGRPQLSNPSRRASSPMPEISVCNKISSIARTVISENVIASQSDIVAEKDVRKAFVIFTLFISKYNVLFPN